MKQPSLDDLMKHVDSKYTLVVAAAKRAREITEGMPKLVESDSYKPVSVALEEISENLIQYERTKAGIK
ncbi:DNA-directed RNA polymerase subunit omega [Phosphitispora fastidiosa]|uniref:DNA-directed RNA polymerase subunit omega n=1 Tax=Phosphitispora fastidiosa TaxID=2837202 RepID=UPI001E4BD229|nr:DNA-directed RNA polymerase subunit omega [Phosphitispora fastidiosa]MBU7008453.1 DNA-directed RNA polymerase subunit omega [Phosphitispora fastidiosa]